MKTQQYPTAPTVFLKIVSVAMTQLKQRLQKAYEQAYPELRDIIHRVLDQEESKAWELTLFPHLLLPDLVEARIATISLQSQKPRRGDVLIAHDFNGTSTHQPAFALCRS